MHTQIDAASIATRRLILRDSLSILSLLLGTVVLFAVTLFLFRSFSMHRADLAHQWSERGQAAMQAGKPEDAIVALRTALTYAPGTPEYEQLLAQALGEAGHIDESTQYFMGLWEAEPGNGFINLELARLAAKRNDHAAAVNFYRASIYGTWEGDGVPRRAEVRLELARYLIAQHQLPAARLELLIAGGNAPGDYDRDMAIAGLLEQAQDANDAWTYYQRAAADRPDDLAALEAGGRLAYQVGDYEEAHRLLTRVHFESEANHAVENPEDVAMMNDAARILELMPLPKLSARERTGRTLAARAIAKQRFDDCSAQYPPTMKAPPSLDALSARWAGPDGTESAAALLRDPDLQDAAMRLVYDTEILTDKICNSATGDDALLLRLATHPNASLPAAMGAPAQATVPRD
jgi:predicted Zn-dependent protease